MQNYISELDTKRFGINISKIHDPDLDTFNEFLTFSEENKVNMAILRTDARNLDIVQEAEEKGFHLMDTIVRYQIKLEDIEYPDLDPRSEVRPFVKEDVESLTDIAQESFTGYYGHYHRDPRLDDDKCTEIYVDWIRRSCLEDGVANQVFVGIVDDSIAGFSTAVITDEGVGEFALAAVNSKARGRGVYSNFVRNLIKYFSEMGCTVFEVDTQIDNIFVQRAWVNMGLRLFKGEYTLHKWFD